MKLSRKTKDELVTIFGYVAIGTIFGLVMLSLGALTGVTGWGLLAYFLTPFICAILYYGYDLWCRDRTVR